MERESYVPLKIFRYPIATEFDRLITVELSKDVHFKDTENYK